MKRLIFLISLFVLLCAGNLFAGQTIKAEVDKNSITTDELLTYKIVVTNSEKEFSKLELPLLAGWKAVSSAESSTVSFVKGDLRTMAVYAIILAPQNTGKLKIGPAAIKTKEGVISSQEFEIEVKQGKKIPRPAPQQKPLPPGESPEKQTIL